MRVLQIGLSKVYGGIESFVMTFFRRLKENGIIFDFVDMYGDGLACCEEINALGGQIYTLENYKKHPIAAKQNLKKIIRENGYSCVHIHMLSAANLLPVTACEEVGVTPIVHSHNMDTIGLARKVLHTVNVSKLRNRHAVRLACGTGAGLWMHGSRDFEVIPNAIDVSSFTFDENSRSEYRGKWNIPDEKIVLGFVGRLVPAKNPLFMLELLASLKTAQKDRYMLLIVGSGSMEDDVRAEAARRGLEKDVVFVGNQSQIGKWLSAMDIFLLPSHFEGLAISGIEAQCSGLPCCFSNKVTGEIAITDLGRFLDISRGADIWAEAVAGCRIDTENRRQYAQSVTDTPYSVSRSSQRLEQLYLRLAKAGGDPNASAC